MAIEIVAFSIENGGYFHSYQGLADGEISQRSGEAVFCQWEVLKNESVGMDQTICLMIFMTTIIINIGRC